MNRAYAVLFLLVGLVYTFEGVFSRDAPKLRRVATVTFGFSGLFAFAALVLTDGEFYPWGFPAVLLLVVAVASGVGYRLQAYRCSNVS